MTNCIAIAETDTEQDIIEKAIRVVPTPRQWAYMNTEYIAFIHWGPNTFSRREWGTGREKEDIFAPPRADTDQWCRVLKAAGMRQVVLTTKHHDGYCLWPSRYTTHSVAGSPWENGKGDVVRSLSDSCKKYGLKLGVYLSPADLYQINSPTGLYGNRSTYSERTIPRPVEGRPFANPTTFKYKVDDYNEYFMNQLFELLTEYGPIYEVWFDGAHPKRKGGQTYRNTERDELIRTLAPDAVIFGKGPDVRWCGNEAGHTREKEWSVIPLSEHPDQNTWGDMRDDDLGGREKLKGAAYLYFSPAEVDTSIRKGWFYRDDTHQRVRSAEEVFDIYERSVGGNTTLILNVPPNREGQLSPRDVQSLERSGKLIRDTYDNNLAAKAHSDAPAVLDNDPKTYWMADAEADSFVVRLPVLSRANRFLFQEAIATHGQRIEHHALDAWIDNAWVQVAEGHTVGYKKILRFDTVETQRFRLRILASRAPATITCASVHFADFTEIEKEKANPTVSRVGWKVHSVSSVHAATWSAEKAFDGNDTTFWHSSWEGGDAKAPTHPHHLAIDMGTKQTITGFSYLPRQDGTPDSMIEGWQFEVSMDGAVWTRAAEGEFGNIVNDPSCRFEHFDAPVTCRYFKLISTSAPGEKPYAGAAEINVLL